MDWNEEDKIAAERAYRERGIGQAAKGIYRQSYCDDRPDGEYRWKGMSAEDMIRAGQAKRPTSPLGGVHYQSNIQEGYGTRPDQEEGTTPAEPPPTLLGTAVGEAVLDAIEETRVDYPTSMVLKAARQIAQNLLMEYEADKTHEGARLLEKILPMRWDFSGQVIANAILVIADRIEAEHKNLSAGIVSVP